MRALQDRSSKGPQNFPAIFCVGWTFLHTPALTTGEIQPSLPALCVTFLSFSLFDLLHSAVTDVMSSSFPCSVQIDEPHARDQSSAT